ncbi:MAG: DUF4412 domain-containing protein [Candidatus Hydrothermae bacterium]|nr:DUF4412 domain-containing protein [Candidatus Hydrothermae bacterium]
MRRLIPILLLLVLAAPAFAGWKVVRIHSNGEGGVDTTVTLIGSQKLRMEASGEITLVDVQKGEIVALLPEQKRYWKGNARTFHRELKTLMDGMMDAMLQQLPEDRRENMRKMIEAQREQHRKSMQRLNARATGATETIAGVKAKVYKLTLDGKVVARLWVGHHPLEKDMDFGKLSAMMRMEDSGSLTDAPAYQKLASEGLILKEERTADQSYEAVVKIEQTDLPDDWFAIPEGYTPATLQELMQGMMNAPMNGGE